MCLDESKPHLYYKKIGPKCEIIFKKIRASAAVFLVKTAFLDPVKGGCPAELYKDPALPATC